MKNYYGLTSLTTIASCLLAAPLAQAQASSNEPQLEEVVVSATKRGDQDLQSTPLTVTAFSSEALRDKGIDNLADIGSLTAGLDIDQFAPGQSQVIIRGVTLGGLSAGYPQNRATTGLYINDASFEQNGMNPDPDLYDLGRVEVLKGPQGTLFGSSAMAGALRYVTKRPEFNTYSGQLLADTSTTRRGANSYSAKGVVNIPLVDDTLAMRVMAYRNENGGWVDNALTGRKDINFDREAGARLSTLWQPSETLSAHLMLQYQQMDVGNAATAQSGDSSHWGPGPQSPEEFITFFPAEASWNDKFLISTLEVNWAISGDTTLTSVTGMVDRKFRNARPGDMGEFLLDPPYMVVLPNPVFTDPYTSGKFSEELRVATKFGEAVNLTAGVYFSDGDITYNSLMAADGLDAFLSDNFGVDPVDMGCVPEHPDAIFCGTQRNDERQVSVYGELDYHLSSRLTATAGARWFKYNQTFNERYAGFFNFGPSEKKQKFSEDGINPKFGLAYDTGEALLVYASGAKGFRMGGVDDPILGLACVEALDALGLTDYTGVFKADSLWTYELGAKSTLFNNRVMVNAAVFDTEWSNIQTSTFLGAQCGYSITRNDAKQTIRGIEVATRFAITNNFSIELNGNYTDARLRSDTLNGSDGDRAPNVPRYTINGTLDYEHRLTDTLSGFGLLTFTHRAPYSTSYTATTTLDLPAQSVLNLRLGMKTERYKISLFARNLTDEFIISGVGDGRGGERDWNTGRPRTLGIELQADF